MLTLTNRIDMRPGAVPLVIHLGQYDSDFSLVFELYSSAGNFTVESGTTAMIRGTKTDGNAYDADATIDVSAKTVTVAGSEQMTAAKGRNVYELVLTKSGKVLSTANFILDVERAAMDADTIASESVLKELNAIIDSAATSTQAATDAASAADRAEDAAESVSSASAQIATNTADISDLKADLKSDENVIGVHRSPKITTYTQTAFAIPQNTTIKIYTLGGEDLPSNRLNVYDSSGTYIDYYTLNSTYGNSRTVFYNKRDVAYIALNSSYAAGIAVVWYEHESLSEDVTELQSDYNALKNIVPNTASIVNNGYYNYSTWENATWSRTSGGAKPAKYSDANRVAFNDLLFVNAGSRIHIEGYNGKKYHRGAWTYVNGVYTNYLWESFSNTENIDWDIEQDSYVEIIIANTDDTTPISVSDIGVVVSVYDSAIYKLEKQISDLNDDIPTRFISEMNSTIASVRECLTEPCLVFPMVTDIHYAPNSNVFQNFDMSVKLMNYLMERIGCDFIANLGDNINGSSDQSLMLSYGYHMLEKYNSVGKPYLFCIGNHDTNYDPGTKFTMAQTYSAFFSLTKNAVYNSATNGTDYYIDYNDLGIRVVILNTQYLGAYIVSADTITWLENSALDTDKIVVLCSHMSSIPTQNIYGQILNNGTDMTNAIQSFVSVGGKIIQLCGHSHADYAFTSPWLTIFSTCGKFEQMDVASAPYQAITGYTGQLVSPSRTEGTATEQAWNVVIIRPSARKVNVIRFGAGNDREFDF